MLDELRLRLPGPVVERLIASRRADDDNVCFIGDRDGHGRVQVGTWPDGRPPFLIEDGSRGGDIGSAGGGSDHELRTLTERERQVLTLVARGMSNTEIARSLVVSEATVNPT